MSIVAENTLQAASEQLRKADGTTRTLDDARKSIGSLIITCGYLIEVIEDQQERIEHLEDVLQDNLERRRR